MQHNLYNWWTRPSRRDLITAIINLEQRIADQNEVILMLQRGLRHAADPFNLIDMQEKLEQDSPVIEVRNEFGEVTEVIAPGAYDYEKLAHDMWDYETGTDGQGGASGSW